jgi:hypothetical protein
VGFRPQWEFVFCKFPAKCVAIVSVTGEKSFLKVTAMLSKLTQAVILLTSIQEVPVSNLGEDTDHSD